PGPADAALITHPAGYRKYTVMFASGGDTSIVVFAGYVTPDSASFMNVDDVFLGSDRHGLVGWSCAMAAGGDRASPPMVVYLLMVLLVTRWARYRSRRLSQRRLTVARARRICLHEGAC